MHVESFDPRSFHPKRTQISFPLSPQFGFELIALARRCITPRCVYYRCLSLSRCVCVPCRTRRAFSLLLHSFRPRPQRVPLPFAFPHLRLAIEPVRSHASRRIPTTYVSSESVHSYSSYFVFRLRCRCHVTRTNWSQALAASRLVALDTTHPQCIYFTARSRTISRFDALAH